MGFGWKVARNIIIEKTAYFTELEFSGITGSEPVRLAEGGQLQLV